MAAARLRRLASSLAASGAAMAASRPARVIGKGAAGASAGFATYSAAEYALGETVPYGGGRRRGPEPLWAAALGGWPEPFDHTTVQDYVRSKFPEGLAQLGPHGLAPVPAGEVRVHWIKAQSVSSKPLDELYPEPYRRAVETSMEAVAAALWREAEETGFGKHVLKFGFNLIVVPGGSASAAVPINTVVLTVGDLNSCLTFARTPNGEPDITAAMAALQFTLAHELAHLYLRHSEERRLMTTVLRGMAKAALSASKVLSALGWGEEVELPMATADVRLTVYQLVASLHKELWWQQEFEADEVACALLARLRLAPEHLAAGAQEMAASSAEHGRKYLQARLAEQNKLSEEQKLERAAELGFPDSNFDAGVALVREAVASGDPDAFLRLYAIFDANRKQRRLLELAKDGSSDAIPVGKTSVGTGSVAGPSACPEHALTAFLADLDSTHPFSVDRLARIRQLSGQLPMLLRAAAPPVAVGGRYSHASVAEQVAAQLAADLAARAAAKEAAAKAAAEQAAAEKVWRWWWPFWPSAAAAALGAAVNAPASKLTQRGS